MRATVVFEDKKVSIDGHVKLFSSMPDHDPNWKVIQWNDDRGWIEVHRGDRIWLANMNIIQPFVDAYNDLVVNQPVINMETGD